MPSAAPIEPVSPSSPLRARLPLWLTALVAVALWRLFYPGLLSADSIDQYGQACVGLFNNWHPPLMAIVLHGVFRAGASLGLLTLGQCLAVLLGLRALALAVLDAVWSEERFTPIARQWAAVLPLLLLLLPWTPLALFAMTFWKDVWAAAALLWLCALLLLPPRAKRKESWTLAVVILGIVLGLARHNAVVALLPAGLLLALAWRHRGRTLRVAIALAPLAGWWLAGAVIDRAFHVRDMHPSSQILAIDLVGVCARGTAVCADLPWTQSNVLDPASLAQYRPGDIGFIAWDVPPHVSPRLRFDFPRLEAEYRHAIVTHPLLLADVKVRAFATLLGLDRTDYFFHHGIVDNPYGLGLSPRFAPERLWLEGILAAVRDGRWRWLSGVHLVWLLANVLAIVAGALLARRGVTPAGRLALVLLLPLAYALSYLAATPVHDFRFLYPATLTTQCVLLSLAVGALAQKPTGRAPSRATFSA
jgi:hypothetical protein